jgi:hypothetical protein
VLVLGIAQLPALLITLRAIGYIWSSGDYGNVEAILFSVTIVHCRRGRQYPETATAGPRCRRR